MLLLMPIFPFTDARQASDAADSTITDGPANTYTVSGACSISTEHVQLDMQTLEVAGEKIAQQRGTHLGVNNRLMG